MQQQSGDGEQEGVSEWFQTSFGLFFWVPQLWEMKKEREKVEKERERETERGRGKERERDRERERKMEDGDKQKARERERQREEEGEERESVVNGEQRGVSEWFQTSFCP